MKKVLFLTYYWPPSGKASLQWPLDMIRYIKDDEWQPYVLTVANDSFTEKDLTFAEKVPEGLSVIKTKTLEPFNAYKKVTGKKKDEQLIASETISKTNKSLGHRLSIWIRMNLFIPDARIGWYPFAVKEGAKFIERERFDYIVSIGPPHSTHLIAEKLSKEYNIPFIPVFIDPWVDISYYKEHKRSSLTLKIDNYLEKKILKKSSAAVFVTKALEEDFLRKYPFLKNKSHVLYWGYNEEAFHGLQNNKDHIETLVHSGNIFDFQNPKKLWNTIKEEINKGRNLKLIFIGTVSPGIISSIKEHGLEGHTEFKGFIAYKEMLQYVVNADYLLVCATEKRHVPGKLFEYLRSGNKILCFGEDNEEIAGILKECNSGMMFSYESNAKEFFSNAVNTTPNMERIKQFDRKQIAGELKQILNEL